MALSNEFNTFGQGKSWQDKVLEADRIWAQVKAMLDEQQLKLPETPRRPDVRMIVNNISGIDIQFKNPGDHSGSKQELIPGMGDKTAAMIMVKGDTLEEQYNNAAILYHKYDLDLLGLSKNFIDDLKAGKLSDVIAEAYGPAPFEQQAGKLVDVTWKQQNGTEDKIVPKKGRSAAYGARAATNEMVILAQFQIYVKGTGTTPELSEGYGMNIAVSSDWQTGAVSTRPIVPSVAITYYGAYTFDIPAVIVHPDGMVKEIDLKNGTVIGLDASLTKTHVMKKQQTPKP
ncbi:MAG: hypothetical protein K8R48_00875 [Alphaproteobacteria bacterium]|nr:hypothetical protein [Alphaproteobacteria bacterium]